LVYRYTTTPVYARYTGIRTCIPVYPNMFHMELGYISETQLIPLIGTKNWLEKKSYISRLFFLLSFKMRWTTQKSKSLNYATENYILDLKSETLVTLEFDTLRTTTQFTLQDLKCPNLISIKVTEVTKKGTKLSLCKGKVLRQIKSQCPKLTFWTVRVHSLQWKIELKSGSK